MLRTGRWLMLVTGIVLASALVWGGVAFSQTADQTSPALEISVTADVGAGTVVYSITIKNTGSSDIADVFVAGAVPEGAEFLGDAATPGGSWFRGSEAAGTPGQSAVWLSEGVRAKSTQGPFVYRVDPAGAENLDVRALVHWRLPTDGSLTSSPASPPASLAALHNRSSSRYNGDCLGCHSDVLSRTTLSARVQEAHTAMMPSVPGYVAIAGPTNQNCSFCHQGADPRDHSAAGIRKGVNAALCTACHGPQGPGKKLYAQ